MHTHVPTVEHVRRLLIKTFYNIIYSYSLEIICPIERNVTLFYEC